MHCLANYGQRLRRNARNAAVETSKHYALLMFGCVAYRFVPIQIETRAYRVKRYRDMLERREPRGQLVAVLFSNFNFGKFDAADPISGKLHDQANDVAKTTFG